MSFDPKVWTIEKPDPREWYWFDSSGDPYVYSKNSMLTAEYRSILPIPSAEEHAALVATRSALESMVESFEGMVPDGNCACHISPPCGDCVEWSCARESISEARAALSRLDAVRAKGGAS